MEWLWVLLGFIQHPTPRWVMPIGLPHPLGAEMSWRIPEVLSLPSALPHAITVLSPGTEQPRLAPGPIRGTVGEVRAVVCRQFFVTRFQSESR